MAEAEALVAEHGVLPNPSYLREHGHCNLAATLWKYPEWFAHLAQETALERHRKERVAEAEALVAKEGLLSYVHDLRKRGHAQLATALECHPEWFAHLPQETALERHRKERVAEAEALLAAQGLLPSVHTLRKCGRVRLVNALSKHPEWFAHLPQTKRRIRTPDEQVAEATCLAKEHGGKLPSPGWLATHGFKWLAANMDNHPTRFAHLGQLRQKHRNRTPGEQIIAAEQLAKAHGRKLPSSGWLQKNGYNWLALDMQNHPERFAHIRQVRCRSPRRASGERMAKAESRAAQHEEAKTAIVPLAVAPASPAVGIRRHLTRIWQYLRGGPRVASNNMVQPVYDHRPAPGEPA